MGEHARRGPETRKEASQAECGVFDIRIDREGLWFYHGSPIGRKELVSLFASVLKRAADGRYLLETPAERGAIEVEDVPFLAVEVTSTGEGRDRTLTFRTNIDEIVVADADHPLRVEEDAATGEPKPYLLVREGLEARLTRAVYYELVELGAEDSIDGETRFGVWSAGCFFELGSLDA
jgi:uncharacterized protein